MRNLHLGFRVSEEELKQIEEVISEAGLDPNKGRSKYLRGLVKSEKGLLTLPKDDIDLLKYHYKNISRVGSLLNQVAFVLNSQYVDAENGGTKEIKIPKQKVIDLVEKIEEDIKQYKMTLMEITRKARLE